MSNYLNNSPIYKDCPPRLADGGRAFCDFRPGCNSEHMVQLQNGLTNSYDYRMWLQSNAEDIMNFNRAYTMKKNHCRPCTAPQVTWSQMRPLRPQTPNDNDY